MPADPVVVAAGAGVEHISVVAVLRQADFMRRPQVGHPGFPLVILPMRFVHHPSANRMSAGSFEEARRGQFTRERVLARPSIPGQAHRSTVEPERVLGSALVLRREFKRAARIRVPGAASELQDLVDNRERSAAQIQI